MTLHANRGLGQRTPASSVLLDQGLENQLERTSASTPELVPLFAMLIAALPVPAHENFLASLVAVTSFPLSKCISEMRAASKSDARKCFACSLQAVTLHWRNSPHLRQSRVYVSFQCACVLLFSRDDRRSCYVPCHSCHKSASVPQHADFHRIRHRLEKVRDNHSKFLSACTDEV